MTIFLISCLVLVVILVLANFKKIGPLFEKLKNFFNEVAMEMRKVTWPTTDEVINSTILVVVTSFVLTVAIWVVDLGIGKVVRMIF